MTFLNEFVLLLKSRYPIIYISTTEEERIEYLIRYCTKKYVARTYNSWDFIDGYQGNPNDKKVKELYDQVRAKFEESQKKEEAPKQEAPKEEELTEGEKRGFKKVIITDPEEEKQKAEKKKQEESKKEEPKIKEEVKAPDAPRRADPAAA